MKIERVDPRDLSLATAEEMSAVSGAERDVEAPEMMVMTGEGRLLMIRHSHSDEPIDGVWLVRSDEGELLGHGTFEAPHWDNPQLGMMFIEVLPSARGIGVENLLLDAQLEQARDMGRSSLLTFSVETSAQTGFMTGQGFTVAQRTAQRRLLPDQMDPDQIARLAADAAEHAADYELVRLDGPAPDEMLPELTSLHEAINDAPLDEIALETEEYPVERIRRYEAAMRARRQDLYRLMARHRRTGEWGGHTIVCVDNTRPGYAIQEDTSVRREHRGHRLGMLLKASMLLWLREAEPGLTKIDTWNATSNTHMIAVNEALGCHVTALGVALQRTI